MKIFDKINTALFYLIGITIFIRMIYLLLN